MFYTLKSFQMAHLFPVKNVDSTEPLNKHESTETLQKPSAIPKNSDCNNPRQTQVTSASNVTLHQEATAASACPSQPMTGKCVVCQKDSTKSCSRCKQVFYCGKVCQRMDWKTHKKACLRVNIY